MKKVLIIQTMILTAFCTFGQKIQTVEPDCDLDSKGSSYAVKSQNGFLVGLYSNEYDASQSTYKHGGNIYEMDDDLNPVAGLTFQKNTSSNQELKIVDVERLDDDGSDEGYVAIGYYESDKNNCDVGSGDDYNSTTSFIFGANSLTTGIETADINIDFDISTSGGPYYGKTIATDVMFDGTYFVVTGYVELPNALGTECSGLTVMTAGNEANRYLPFIAKYSFDFESVPVTASKIYHEVFWTTVDGEVESFIPNRIIQNPNNSHYVLLGRWWGGLTSAYEDGVAAQMTVYSDLVGGNIKIRYIKPLLNYASEVTQVKVGHFYSDDIDNGRFGFFIAGNDLSSSQENGFFRITDKSFIPMGTLDIEDPGSKSINIIDFDWSHNDEHLVLLGTRDEEAIALTAKITGSISIYTTFTYSIIENAGYCFDEKLSRKYPKMLEPKTLFNYDKGSFIWGYGQMTDGELHTEIKTDFALRESCDEYNNITTSNGSNVNYILQDSPPNFSNPMVRVNNLFDEVKCTPYTYSLGNPCD